MPMVTRMSTFGNVYRQSTQPQDISLGNIWIDTSTTKPRMWVSNGTTYVTMGIPVGGSSVPMESTV